MKRVPRSIKRLVQAGLGVAGLGVAFCAFVGVAHTELGRPLLAYVPGMGASCPVGLDAKLSLVERDDVRDRTLATLRGGADAASQRAFGFELDQTTLEDVRRWEAAHQVHCTPADDRGQMRCDDVPGAAVESTHGLDTLLLQFDAGARLVAVDGANRSRDVEEAAAFVHQRAEHLRRTIGPAVAAAGEASAEHLASGQLRQASVEFRFANLRARVVATNMGPGGYVLREYHQSLRGVGG
jgi:hypothetical protein